MKRNQRGIATSAFLLAFFLEICGCNPVRTCEQLRLTRVSSMPWEILVQQCAQCLSAQEMTLARQVADNSIETRLASTLVADRTLEEALRELREPSFDSHEDATQRVWNGVGGRNALATTAAIAIPKPIAWPIPGSVLFLYDRAPGEGGSARRIGTGFILTVADSRHRRVNRYLVTARHVLQPEWASCGAKNPGSITVRFNRWTGGVGYESIVLDDRRSSLIVTPSDELTDLAMVPLNRETLPNLDSYKLTETEFDMLPTSVELSSLHHEQRIVTAGISLPKMNGVLDFPISDPGVLAATASEVPVKVRCSADSPTMPIQLWLIGASIPEGVSGAPVYAEMARGPVLVGIQSVVWSGKGLAGMTPASALTELVQLTLSRDEVAMDLRRGVPH